MYPFVTVNVSKGPDKGKKFVVDIYDLIESIGYKNVGQMQAMKKVLRGGRTGKDWFQDMKEVIESAERAIEIEQNRKASK